VRLDALARTARDPRAWLVAAAVVFAAVGLGWGLPASDTWAEDAVSPRSCALFAIAQTYVPGHFHQYPPLHMALLTLTSLPWVAGTIARMGVSNPGLEAALIDPRIMTPVEVCARLLALAMFAGIVWNVTALFTRIAGKRGGLAAGAIVVTNATLVYYAHTGNLEVPYLFWSSWALLELDRVLAGEPRALQAMAAVTCAVLTKDQAAGLFVLTLPACVIARPSLLRERRTWIAIGASALVFAIVSGALPNPSGFKHRLATLFGPASEDWSPYAKTLAGRLAIARDALLSVPRYASWFLAIAACAGVFLAASTRRGIDRTRALIPLLAAVSFTLVFTLSARRTEDRFLLPQSVLLFPYAGFAVEAWLGSKRVLIALVSILAFIPPLLAVASVDATLLADSRYAAERFLSTLPAGTRIEAYGGSHFLPRIPASLVATRVGVDDPDTRSHVFGVTDVRALPSDIDARHPDYVVLGAEHSHTFKPIDAPRARYGTSEFADADSFRFFVALTAGALDYTRVFRGQCKLPWPLECRRIHGATGRELWIYRRARTSGAPTPMRDPTDTTDEGDY
jgi:hypothetical protein